MRGRTELIAVPSRFFPETSMVITWFLRAVSEFRTWVSVSLRGRTSGRTASSKWASTPASRASVLASVPVARAKSQTRRGLTTATGKVAVASAATNGNSKPPVASSSTRAGPNSAIWETNSLISASS